MNQSSPVGFFSNFSMEALISEYSHSQLRSCKAVGTKLHTSAVSGIKDGSYGMSSKVPTRWNFARPELELEPSGPGPPGLSAQCPRVYHRPFASSGAYC